VLEWLLELMEPESRPATWQAFRRQAIDMFIDAVKVP
jgi:hypothetical protein